MGQIRPGYRLGRGENLADLTDVLGAQRNLMRQTGYRSSLAPGWYTIGTLYERRAVGRFGLTDISGGNHQELIFNAAVMYSQGAQINLLSSTAYSGSPIRGVRIRTGGVYDGAMLQVYIDLTGSNVKAFFLGDNFHFRDSGLDGWEIKDWVPDGADPGGLKNFAGITTTSADIDIVSSNNPGMIVGGELYAGGSTAQHKVWHSGSGAQAYAAAVTANAVGTYAMLKNMTVGDMIAGSLYPAADLRWSSTADNDGGTVNGTWRAMGACPSLNSTVFLRVS